MSVFLLLSSLQGLVTSRIFFSHLIYFSLSQYRFNVKKKKKPLTVYGQSISITSLLLYSNTITLLLFTFTFNFHLLHTITHIYHQSTHLLQKQASSIWFVALLSYKTIIVIVIIITEKPLEKEESSSSSSSSSSVIPCLGTPSPEVSTSRIHAPF